MGVYERWVLPHVIRLACGSKPIRKQREKVVPKASGVVVEIGIGAGANLPFYDPSRVRKVIGIDPSVELRKYAEREARKVPFEVEIAGLGGEEIPLDDASADTVVTTYTLCTIPDAVRALREMRRVLKPGGNVLFSEHGLAPDPSVRRWQHRLNGVWGRIGGGCHLDRDIPALFREAGLDPVDLHCAYIPGPRFASFHYWGAAH